MKNENKSLTSIRLDPQLYEEFKDQCKRDKFSLQKLVSRSIFLYLTDMEYKEKVYNQSSTKVKK
jgi:hypothetical protein